MLGKRRKAADRLCPRLWFIPTAVLCSLPKGTLPGCLWREAAGSVWEEKGLENRQGVDKRQKDPIARSPITACRGLFFLYVSGIKFNLLSPGLGSYRKL